MGLEGSVRMIDKASYEEFGMSQPQYKDVLRLFNEWRRTIDPLCGPAKKVALIPQKACCCCPLPHKHPPMSRVMMIGCGDDLH